MRKKVSLLVMMLAIVFIGKVSLNANAQPYEVTPGKEIDDKKAQIQALQKALNDIQEQIREVQKEIQQLKDQEKELQQEITKVKQGGQALAPTGLAEDTDAQQQNQGNGGQGGQQAKLQQLQHHLHQIREQIDKKQLEQKQLELKLQQLEQMEGQFQKLRNRP